MTNTEIIDCTTCKYGYEDERLGIPMCHHPSRFSKDCVDFNMHEEKEIKESEKLMKPEDAMKELDEKIALVKRRGTWDGVDVDKYMDEVRGREPETPKDLEEAAETLAEQHGFVKKPNCKPARYSWSAVRDVFIEGAIAGAKWDRQQMLKEAVEGDYDCQYMTPAVFLDKYLDGIKDGDKVRIIIVKED